MGVAVRPQLIVADGTTAAVPRDKAIVWTPVATAT
jgi:hypothetical protein